MHGAAEYAQSRKLLRIDAESSSAAMPHLGQCNLACGLQGQQQMHRLSETGSTIVSRQASVPCVRDARKRRPLAFRLQIVE
eukprot:6275004-Amphidinium_carterae.1